MTKSKLRKIYLARQGQLSPQERSDMSRRIAERFFQSIDLGPVKTLHCFIAIDKFGEIDTTGIFQRLWHDFPHIVTLVPRVNFESGEIESLRFTPDTDLIKNIWDIHEPAHDIYVEPGEIDMVLVPLVCFDKGGYRVGYGKGFYDKFLGRCRPGCFKVGLSYFQPVETIGDTGDHDVMLDIFVTPEKIYRMAGRGGEGKQ